MEYQQIHYGVDNGIATITLDRPERLNAFTLQMTAELLDAFDQTDNDDDVRAVIVTGRGRGFCAGADLGGGGATFSSGGGGAGDPRDSGGRVTLRIFESRKPVIAAVNGPAVGVGASMILPMDIRIASTEARFGFVHVRRGIVPEACSTWFLPRVVGISRAAEWSMSGRVFPAAEALEAGLVRSVVAAEELLTAAHAIAREIADKAAPVSVALTRQMLWRLLGADHPMAAHRLDSRAVLALGQLSDAREGIEAFLAKRPPRFANSVRNDMPGFVPWWDEPRFD